MSSNDDNAARAQRLLNAIHPVCSHDLPNQVVALQSLLQLFAWDEAEHLTAQGHEYFDRIVSIAGKTAIFAQHLKELIRLQRHQTLREKFSLAQFFDELRSEVQRGFPDQNWTWRCRMPIDSVELDRRLLHQGLMNLLQATVSGRGGAAGSIDVETAARQPGQLTCTMVVQTAAREGAAPERTEAAMIQERLAWSLAQEYLAATDVACAPVDGQAAGMTSFVLEIPNRPPHG